MARKKYEVVDVKYLNDSDVENRELKITLDNGTEITAVACMESFEQWGGTEDEMWSALPTIKENLAWLQGALY